MIFVDKHPANKDMFKVKFKPTQENLSRMRQIPGARYDGDKQWDCPIAFIDDFEKLFSGEYIYNTPRHELTGEEPPPPPSFYTEIPKEKVELKLPLYNYQLFGANFLAYMAETEGQAFLTDRVGTGKTAQSIAGHHILRNKGLVDTALVFCKASLKYQWLRDGIYKFTDDEGIVIDGTKAKRKKLYKEARKPIYRYVIANYELLLNDFDELQQLVKDKQIKLVIADEAHKITNPKGKTNNKMAQLIQPDPSLDYEGVPYVFYLTATPLASKIEQLYGIFSIRRPDIFGKYNVFVKNHLKYSYNGRHQELVGYKNLDDIREKTWRFMLRRTDKEIDMELPEMNEIFVDLPFTSLQLELDRVALEKIQELADKIQSLQKENTEEKHQKLLNLEGALKSMFYVRRAISDHPQLLLKSKSEAIKRAFAPYIEKSKEANVSPKFNELMDIIDDVVLNEKQKLIIFSEFETMVSLIHEELKKKGIPSVMYSGKMDAQKKDEAVRLFRDTKDCNIFIATDAAAEGINLQIAKYMVNYDLPWNPDIFEQRKGRIQRGGSNHQSVTVFNLRCEEGIDMAVWEAINKKQNLFNFFVENTKQQSEAIIRAMEG